MRSRASAGRVEMGSAQNPPPPERAFADVRELNRAYIAAVRRGDAGWFSEHMSDDVVVRLGGGERLGKPEFVARLEDGSRTFRSLGVENVTVRAFGPVVQVDADAPWELEGGGAGVSRYIDTYVWLDGRWQVISAQVTPLAAGAGADA